MRISKLDISIAVLLVISITNMLLQATADVIDIKNIIVAMGVIVALMWVCVQIGKRV